MTVEVFLIVSDADVCVFFLPRCEDSHHTRREEIGLGSGNVVQEERRGGRGGGKREEGFVLYLELRWRGWGEYGREASFEDEVG